MSKSLYLNKFAFTLLVCSTIFSAVTAAFGQSGDLQSELKKSFGKFDLIRLDSRAARQKIQSRQSVNVPTADKNFELILSAHDLRPRNYRAEEATSGGTRALERTEVTTFKGTIAGETNSQVRLTIDAGKIEGYFVTQSGERFYVEPAGNFSRLAAAEDFVVYQERDLLATDSYSCALEDRIERGKETVNAVNFQTATTLRVIEMATEADFAFVSELGGAAQANNEILGILNLIEGNYEAELGLTFDVVFQHAWTTPDPFDGTNASTLLNSFRTFWNANYPQISVPRDAAHLFTSRANFIGRGNSYLGSICVSPNSAYGFTGRFDYELIKYVLTAHEIAHNLGANHVGAGQGCDNTVMNQTVSNLTPIDFCQLSRGEVASHVAGGGGSCLSPRTVNRTRFDFDGDGKADAAVFRPSTGAWYLNQSAHGFAGVSFGSPTDKIVPADYDGDGKTDIAVYRGGVWYRLKSSTGTFDGVNFGAASDVPAPADYDGDGKADVAVFRPADGVWHRLLSANDSYAATAFGANGDIPVVADYDADGKADLNVFRPATGTWFRMNSGSGAINGAAFGAAGDKPLAGDFDGDGKTDVSIFRPSNGGWYALRSSDNLLFAAAFGFSTDVPAPADFDGDGKTDVCVFRPSIGTWFRLNSSNGGFAAAAFGANGDIPVSAFYVQ